MPDAVLAPPEHAPRPSIAGRNAAARRTTLPPLLQRFLLATLLLWTLCLAAQFISRAVLHLPEVPYGRLTLQRSDDYVDILMFPQRFHFLHSDRFFAPAPLSPHFLYPAPASLLYAPYYRLAGPNERLFLALVTLTLLVAAAALFRLLCRRGLAPRAAALFTLVSLVCSYPAFFEFNRANIELFVWIAALLGLWAHLAGHPCRAAFLFGCAASLKFYPLLYLGLLLPRRHFRAIALGLLTFAGITLASLWLIDPNLAHALQGIRAGNQEFAQTYIYTLRPTEIGLDHSLVGLAKRLLPHLPPPVRMQHSITLYLAVAALLGIALFFTRILRLPVLNQLLCLVVASILLPPVSYDYTLLHLYLPWTLLVLLLVTQHRDHQPTLPGTTAVMACFAILLSPENEFILHGTRFGGQLKALTLATLFALALRFRFPSPFDATPASQPR